MLLLAKSGTFYVLKAPVDVAEEISHLQASGAAAFSLALRPDVDTRQVDASALGTTTNRVIIRYGLPIPVAFPPVSGPVPTPRPTPVATPCRPARRERHRRPPQARRRSPRQSHQFHLAPLTRRASEPPGPPTRWSGRPFHFVLFKPAGDPRVNKRENHLGLCI